MVLCWRSRGRPRPSRARAIVCSGAKSAAAVAWCAGARCGGAWASPAGFREQADPALIQAAAAMRWRFVRVTANAGTVSPLAWSSCQVRGYRQTFALAVACVRSHRRLGACQPAGSRSVAGVGALLRGTVACKCWGGSNAGGARQRHGTKSGRPRRLRPEPSCIPVGFVLCLQ